MPAPRRDAEADRRPRHVGVKRQRWKYMILALSTSTGAAQLSDAERTESPRATCRSLRSCLTNERPLVAEPRLECVVGLGDCHDGRTVSVGDDVLELARG